MSVIGHIRLVPAAAWPLGVGLLVNSAILFSNLGVDMAGALPIARDRLGKSELAQKDRIRIWSLFYKKAASLMVPGILSSTALHLLAAYLTPSRRVRNFALAAALTTFTILPHTLFFILPTNKIILALDTKPSLTPAEENDVPFYLAKWQSLHRPRYVQYVVGWTAGLGALLGVAGRW